MKPKTTIALLLMTALLLTGCGKEKETEKKSKKAKSSESIQSQEQSDTENDDFSVPPASETRHFNIWDDDTHIEYKREKGFYTKYCDEMIDEAKKRLPDEINKITVYKVDTEKISKYDGSIRVRDQFDIAVSGIQCDLDSVKCIVAQTMTQDSWSDKPTGIVLLLTADVHVTGTRSDTGAMVDETYVSSFIVSRMGMTMTMDASEILDEGTIEFDFQYLNTCYGYFEYWISSDQLPDKKLLDESILEQIALYSDPDHVSSYSNKEEQEYNDNLWKDYKGLFPKSIQEDVSIFYDGHTGLEDPFEKQRETADPTMGDGDDEPLPDE